MGFWNSLTNLLGNPSFQSFLISCGASASYDGLKKVLERTDQKDSFELQVYQIMRDTFQAFYQKYGLEFDEESVMTAFFDSVQEIKSFSRDNITKAMICGVLGLETDSQELNEWEKIFTTTCSNPKYQWVYNKLSFTPLKVYNSKHKAWMDTYMKGNHCKIQCDLIEELPPIFDGISTKLSSSCWYHTRVLVWEIIFNAQQHGYAHNCTLIVKENSITIVDDGERFNPLLMEKQFWKQGGSRALELFRTSYPEVLLQSAFCENCNQFKIDFCDNVFDVNEMSEIIVPDLILISTATQFQFKHPKGLFKYYYIDIDEISRTIDDELFATISGLWGLLEGLHIRFKDQAEVEKIFIYYSDMARVDYQIIYNSMNDILKSPNLEGSKIVLCSGQL